KPCTMRGLARRSGLCGAVALHRQRRNRRDLRGLNFLTIAGRISRMDAAPKRKTKTLFIGLDGCTFTVLDEMTRDLPGVGVTMPFMKKILENGVRAKLRSTPNPLTPPAWVSLMTGKGPGEHGVFDFV